MNATTDRKKRIDRRRKRFVVLSPEELFLAQLALADLGCLNLDGSERPPLTGSPDIRVFCTRLLAKFHDTPAASGHAADASDVPALLTEARVLESVIASFSERAARAMFAAEPTKDVDKLFDAAHRMASHLSEVTGSIPDVTPGWSRRLAEEVAAS